MAEPVYPQFFTSFQLNAPQMGEDNAADGQMLQVLDAILVTGCCPNTVASAVIVGDEVKLTFGVLHGYKLHQFLVLSGASSTALNGKHRITKVTETTVSIAKGSISDVTGTITTLLAPLGWESIFGNADPLRRAYRSKEITSTKTVLYLDCSFKSPKSEYVSTGSRMKRAAVVVCKNMTTLGVPIEPYTPPIATTPASSRDGVFHWIQMMYYKPADELYKFGYNNPWVICGDSKFFYFFSGFAQYSQDQAFADAGRLHVPTSRRGIYMFGDLPRVSVADRNPCVFAATSLALPENKNTPFPSSAAYSMGGYFNITTVEGAYFVEDIVNPKVRESIGLSCTMGGGSITGGNDTPTALNPLTFGYPFSEIMVRRNTHSLYAGKLPYLRGVAANLRHYPEGIDLTMHGNHLMVRLAPDSGGDFSSQNSYAGLDLMTPREEDRL